MSSSRALAKAILEVEAPLDKNRGAFMYMPCDPRRRAEAGERALMLGGTPRNIAATVRNEIAELRAKGEGNAG